MYKSSSELMRQSSRAGVRFLLAEAELGLTFLDSAVHTAVPGTRERCVNKAHNAYCTIRRLLPRVQPERDEELDLQAKLKKLQEGLMEAGYSPDRLHP